MKKIQTLFVRDWDGDPSRVLDEVSPGCEWVTAGEGVATEKFDGEACMIRGGQLFKRYDRMNKRKKGTYKDAPPGWEECQGPDEKTGHWFGWVPVGDEPESKWFREGFKNFNRTIAGTYELVGPHVRKNPYAHAAETLVPHGEEVLQYVPKPVSFEGLRDWLEVTEIEGIVWHHPDGRMAKIKRRDFGLAWPVKDTSA